MGKSQEKWKQLNLLIYNPKRKEINLRLAERGIWEEKTLTPRSLDISSKAENPFDKTLIKTEFQEMVFSKSK